MQATIEKCVPSRRKRVRGLMTAVVTLVVGSGVAPSAAAATVAYWRFEDGNNGAAATTITDSSGNGLAGTAVNGPVFNSSVASPTVPATGLPNGTSLVFNGASQRVYVPDYPALALTQSFTIEAYVNVRGQVSQNNDIVFRGDDRVSLDPYSFGVGGGNLKIEITNASDAHATASASLPYNTWVHVAATLDHATGKLSLYENGTLVAFTTTTVRPYATLNNAYTPGVGIGNVQSSNYSQYFDGRLDEIRISNTALSPSQFLNAVPEPTAGLLVAAGGSLVLGLKRRRRGDR